MNINITIPAFLCDWPFYAGFALAAIIGIAAFVTFLRNCGPRF